ncbi:MAG: pyruvate oxidase [Sphingomonadaceae bacterium]|nr:pyruvate oxidase [Sphingomonadaceae bacterium]
MAKKTTADIMLGALSEWGVTHIFGLPGDGINGLMEALRVSEDIRFIQTRHEEAAAFMACAYAKFTGKLGVCLATSGPGGIHLLNGLYDAKLDGQPVLAITGMQHHDLIGTHGQQDVELDKLFADVAGFNERIMGPAHARGIVDLACREALANRTVSHITIPVDFQSMACDADTRSKRNVPGHSVDAFARAHATPSIAVIDAAAEILNAGKKIMILAGQGALGATDALEAVAERLKAPLGKPLLGKGCLPDDSPYSTGGVGLLGTRPSHDALDGCDTLLIVGSSFPYIEFYPKPGQARIVQIDIDAARIGLRCPVEQGLIGDSRTVLEALLPRLTGNDDPAFLTDAQNGMREWWALMEERGTRADMPMKPQVVAWELGKRLSSDAIVVADSGTIATWFARQIPAKRGQMFSLSGTLASMANGLPYAIAAQVAHPDRTCVACVGDGGLTMLMGELATAVKHKLPIRVIVFKNDVLGMIKWEQMAFLGNPEFGVELQPIDFVKVAEACGAKGFRIEKPGDCGRVLDEAFATSGPVLIEAVVDPDEPPMPAKIGLSDALNLGKALVRGQKDRGRLIATLARDTVRELI